jgi:hypothetical protein
MEQCAEEARSNHRMDQVEGDKYNCFFKVIDVLAHGKATKDVGECFYTRQLNSFYNSVPTQSENTIRLIMDGRHRRIHLSRNVQNKNSDLYPSCSSLLGSNHIYHTPSPCPLYSSPAIINDTFRYHHIPTLRRFGERDGGRRWYGMSCFASHIDDCPSLTQQLHPWQSTFEKSDAYFTVFRNEKGLLTGKSSNRI